MTTFNATTQFILNHKDLVLGTGFAMESSKNGEVEFNVSIQRDAEKKFKSIDLAVSGQAPFNVEPGFLAEALLAGRPLVPFLLDSVNAPTDLIQLASAAQCDDMDLFESFTLGDVTISVAYEAAPANPEKPVGYRLSIRIPKTPAQHFGLSVNLVANAISVSQPVLGYALDQHPAAAQLVANAIGLSIVGMKSAFQIDVDEDSLASIPIPTNLPSGKKPAP